MAVAVRLAETVLNLDAGKFEAYGYSTVIGSADGKAIGIDRIRELDRFLSLKVPASSELNRAVIIENSHLLTLEAQNAVLKLLEEPPEGTILILTADRSQSLLPTIRSRTQIIQLNRPDQDQLSSFFIKKNKQVANIEKAYSISGGLPGLMSVMLDEEEHPLTSATEWARKLLSQPAYEKLLSVDELSKDKDLATNITFILKQMAHVSLQNSSGKSAGRWESILKASYEANEYLNSNANTKLTLTKLMLAL